MAFTLGALVTVGGLCAAVPIFVGKNLSVAVMEIFRAFPAYAGIVVITIATGLIGGFITGLIYALVGGKGDYWLSFLLLIAVCMVSQSTLIIPFIPIIILGSIGAQYPELYLLKKPLQHERLKPLRQYLSESWITRPPKFARPIAYFLPLVIYGVLDVYF
ncbi:MAG: hypothetical protein EOP04_25490 [Proteobacteria bacterium]|nr:MAG: hypothetical protein EOP04_25490 [Pseudomonadota bacterium]